MTTMPDVSGFEYKMIMELAEGIAKNPQTISDSRAGIVFRPPEYTDGWCAWLALSALQNVSTDTMIGLIRERTGFR